MSATVDRPMPSVSSRAYAMKARGDQDALEVIAGIISLYGIEMHALIDPGSTHSYVCIEHLFDKMTVVEQLSYDMHVASPLEHSFNVNRVYKNCLIIIHDREFSADLITLPFREFDLILGMDCLSKHRAIINSDKKTVVLRCSDQSEVIVHGVRSGPMSNVISAMKTRRLLRKGCEAFLALVLNFKRCQIELENILVVKDFSHVSPKSYIVFHLKEKWIFLLRFYWEQLLLLGHHTGWLQLS